MTRLRLTVNSQTVVKAAGILSNGLLLVTNSYLIASGFRNNLRERRTQRIHDNLQLTAEIAGAVAGLTKVISQTLETAAHASD
ncbi:MAG: hypothetical protein H6627_10800 [Calditrichae bacterium]|nr:hypothetical protein [Calditrichia bacterium]